MTEGEARSSLTLSCRSVAIHAGTSWDRIPNYRTINLIYGQCTAARKTGKCVSAMIATHELEARETWKAREIHESGGEMEPEFKKIKLEPS